jgi:hypothetical protein
VGAESGSLSGAFRPVQNVSTLNQSYVGNVPTSFIDPTGFGQDDGCVGPDCPGNGGDSYPVYPDLWNLELRDPDSGRNDEPGRQQDVRDTAQWRRDQGNVVAQPDPFANEISQTDAALLGSELVETELTADLLGHTTTAAGLLVGVQSQTALEARNLTAFRFTTMHKAGAAFSEMSPYRDAYNAAASSSKTWSNLLKGTKFVSQGFFVVSAGANVWQAGNAVSNRDWGGVASATADVSFGYYAATGGLPGLVAGATWTVFYNGTSALVEIPHVRARVVTPIVDAACRLSGGC